MVTPHQIEKLVEVLSEQAQFEKILLFGSYATGNADENSDVDIMCIGKQIHDKRKEMVRLRKAVRSLRVPVDIFVTDNDTIDQWGNLNGTVNYWALKEGKTLYEAH